MTVQADPTTHLYNYSGPGSYVYDFRVFDETDVVVTYFDSDGVGTVLALGTDYTVSDSGVGGTVDSTYAETVGSLQIKRQVPQTQPEDLQNGDDFDQEAIERALDRATMQVQELSAIVVAGVTNTVWRGPWVTGAEYSVSAMVTGPDANIYTCLDPHTSGVFLDDLASLKWRKLIDVEAVENSASAAAQSEANALASEQTATAGAVSTAADALSTAADVVSTNADALSTAADVVSTNADATSTAADVATVEAIVASGQRIDSLNTDYYTATASQVDFTVTEPAPETNIQVFMNSRKLRVGEDYTLDASGSTPVTKVTLDSGAAAGDEVDIISYNTITVGTGVDGYFRTVDGKTMIITNGYVSEIVQGM
jgi:hypothetical protein